MTKKAYSNLNERDFLEIINAKRSARMKMVDELPKAIRDLVNDYGLNVVKTCLDLGVKKPHQIKHLVETILNEFSPTRGSYSNQGISSIINLPRDKHR